MANSSPKTKMQMPPAVPPTSGPRFDALKDMLSARKPGDKKQHPIMQAVSKHGNRKYPLPSSFKKARN